MIRIFESFPPRLSVLLFYLFITLGLVWTFLFRSVLGAFLLAVAVYFYVVVFTPVEPYGGGELLAWFSSLPSEYRVALLTSFVTVAGFAVAFHTATVNWRNKSKADLMAQTAGEFENFFAIVSRNITTAQLFARDLVDVVNAIQNGATIEEASFRIGFVQGRMNEFVNARDVLSRASIEVHRLIGRNNNILASGWGLLANARATADALSRITESMWIRLPIVDMNAHNRIQMFLNIVNVTECNQFIEACEVGGTRISAISGGIHGYLLAPVIGFPLPMYWHMLRNRKVMLEAVREFYQAKTRA